MTAELKIVKEKKQLISQYESEHLYLYFFKVALKTASLKDQIDNHRLMSVNKPAEISIIADVIKESPHASCLGEHADWLL